MLDQGAQVRCRGRASRSASRSRELVFNLPEPRLSTVLERAEELGMATENDERPFRAMVLPGRTFEKLMLEITIAASTAAAKPRQ